MSDDVTQRMTASEVEGARRALGLERADLGRLLGNKARTIRDWEEGKTFTPVRLAAQIHDVALEVEEATDRALKKLVADLRTMDPPRVLVFREEDKPLTGDVARFGVSWWLSIAQKAKEQVPGTRIGNHDELSAIDMDLEQR